MQCVAEPEPVKRQLLAAAGAKFVGRLRVCKFIKNVTGTKNRNFFYATNFKLI
jgi:hypothetical protein